MQTQNYSQQFLHDHYGHLKDHLLNVQQMRSQTLSLYLLLLIGAITIKAALLAADKESVILDFALLLILFGSGNYAYTSLLFLRHSEFHLRLRMDKITALWAPCLPDAVTPYLLPQFLAKLCPEASEKPAKRKSQSRVIGWLRDKWSRAKGLMFKTPNRVTDLYLHSWEHVQGLTSNEKEFAGLILVNSVLAALLIYLLPATLPALGFLPLRTMLSETLRQRPILIAVAALSVIAHLWFYIRQDVKNKDKCNKEIMKISRLAPGLGVTGSPTAVSQ